MKLLVRRKTLGWSLKWAHRALLLVAILLLGYCGFALADSWVFQWRESRDLDQLRSEFVANQGSLDPPPPASQKGLIDRIELPRLRLSVVVIEGIGRTTLRRGIGHIPGTALPRQPGNVGLAGYRDTLFRPLQNLRINDEIRFSTPRGGFRYEIESLRIVDPNDVGVLAASGDNVLTMVTCYPFFYVGRRPSDLS